MGSSHDSVTVLEHLCGDGITELLRVEHPTRPAARALLKRAAERQAAEAVIALHTDIELVRQHQLPCMLTPLQTQSHGAALSLFYEDQPGQSPLAFTKASLEGQLDTAIAMVRALETTHDAGLIHRALHPGAFLLHEGSAWLVDFSHAMHRQREQRDIQPVGTNLYRLNYRAPEQSGRLNRDVDERADLYSLGVILYQMLTTRVPFPVSDPHELVYCHLARAPLPPSQHAPHLPAFIDEVILKLLSKDPRNRHHSARALREELTATRELLQGGHRDPLSSSKTISRSGARLDLPRRLYGREEQRQQLFTTFNRACQGVPQLTLIAGQSGIGKTALIRETYIAVTRERAFFVAGKWDQFHRQRPYGGWIDAIENLVTFVLAEPDSELERWREQILSSLGSGTALLTDLIPELTTLVGEQPTQPDLPPQEAKERFHETFRRFIEVFSTAGHPLVIFLDDLQWIDPGSLKLLSHLLTHTQQAHLLIIGAFRDNEVDASHPLRLALETQIETHHFQLTRLVLPPLNESHLTDLAADTLNLSAEQATTLATEVARKTGGNPFFVWQFLQSLQDKHLLLYDPREQRWRWRLSEIRSADFANNVIELMLHRFHNLPADTQKLLSRAACLGTRFHLSTLAQLAEDSETAIWQQLQAPLNEEFILPLSAPELVDEQPVIRLFRFMHDRMQEAAYKALPEAEFAPLHYRIARQLLKRTPAQDLDEQIMSIAAHLNKARELIRDEQGQLEFARINLQAATRAKATAAFSAACDYLRTGMAPLEDRLWEIDHELAYALFRERGELEYLNGDFQRAEHYISSAIEREPDPLRRTELYHLLVTQYTLLARYEQAIQVAREGLAQLGAILPDQDYEQARDLELDRIEVLLGDESLSTLASLPAMTDTTEQAILKLLISIGPPCYRFHPGLWAVVVAQQVRRCLAHGLVPEISYSFPALGGLLTHVGRGDGSHCQRLCQITETLTGQWNNPTYRSIGRLMMGSSLRHWFAPLSHSSDDYLNAYESGLESGNLQYAVYGFGHNTYCRYFQGRSLEILIPEALGYLAFSRRRGNLWGVDLITGALRVFQMLYGRWHRADWPERDESEAEYLQRCTANNNRQVLCIYFIMRADAQFHLGLLEDATQSLREASHLLDTVSIQGLYPAAHYHGLRALLLAHSPRALGLDESAAYEQLVQLHEQFGQWSEHAPSNFLHWKELLGAELASLDGDLERTLDQYDLALNLTEAPPNATAMVAQRAALFWAKRSNPDFAMHYWRRMGEACSRWQAHQVLKHTLACDSRGAEGLELPAVIRIAEALSLHTSLTELVPEITRNVAQQTGAQRVALTLCVEEQLFLVMDSTPDYTAYNPNQPRLDQCDNLPRSLLRYVARTQNSFRFNRDDIGNSLLLRSDDYLVASLDAPSAAVEAGWCIPLIYLGEMVGILYLEHRLVADAFRHTEEALIEFLASQAAISIRNLALLNRLAEEAEARREAELRMQSADAEITMHKEHEQVLRQLASTDYLTNLPNRRALMERIEEEWHRQQRQSLTPATLLMLDIDYFKAINDRHGHAVGDQVLRDLADIFREQLRNFDLPARIGGEEFGLLLRDVGMDQALQVAERLRQHIEQSPTKTSAGHLLYTVSIGVTAFQENDPSYEDVLRRADEALYDAKRGGRNQVASASLEQPASPM